MTEENLKKLIRPNIAGLKPYVCARHNLAKGILMDANENPYGKYNRYPDPLAIKVKELLCDYLNVKTNNLFVGNGSDEAIDLLFRIFCEPEKDDVIIFEPGYGMYSVCADTNNVKYTSVLLTEDFQIDVKKTLEVVTQNTKLIFACSPNNPTSNCLNDSDIFKLCEKFNGIVVVDEAYIEFADKESLVSKINKYPNLVVLRTLSKAWGGAGIRVGYAVANPIIIETLNKTKAPYNVSKLSQEAACRILKNKKRMETEVKRILKERERVSTELKKMRLTVYPSDANFIIFKIPNASFVQKQIQDAGIIIRDRSKMPLLTNCLRPTIGSKKENNLFLKTLKKCLKKIAFIDRDGVMLFEPQDDFQVDSLAKYKILPNVIDGMKNLKNSGYMLVMVSNQDGLGTDSFPEKDFLIVQNKLIDDLKKEGISFDAIFICPHFPTENCACRKPKLGLVKKFLEENPIDFEKSIMIGDRKTDMKFAENLGIKGFMTKTNSDSLFSFSKKIKS